MPAISRSTVAASSAVQHSGPATSSDQQLGKIPARLTSPKVGLMPASPHAAAGSRTEPPVSDPSANSAVPAATAAPAPEDEPPVKCPMFHGACCAA